MKIRPSALVIVTLLCLFPAAVAFGQTVQFDKYFTCGGERQLVSSCFDDSNDAYCMVMYPDRPLRNGFEVQITEKRGDVIKKIQGCMGAGATLASTGHPAPGPASGRTPAGAAPAGPVPAIKPGGATPQPDPSVAKARAAGVDTTLLGLQVGQPLALTLCQRVGVIDLLFSGGNGYAKGQQFPCAEAKDQSAGQMQNVATPFEVNISFADGVCPSWVSPCQAVGLIRNGVLLSVYLGTNGQTGDAAVANQLRSKYGKPSTDQIATFKNLYNYSAQFHQLEWNLPGLHVEYHPFLTDINIGGLWVETETGHQLRISGQAVQQKQEPKL